MGTYLNLKLEKYSLVVDKINQFQKNDAFGPEIVTSIGVKAKEYFRKANREKFSIKSGRQQEAIRFIQKEDEAKARLLTSSLTHIFESKGAYIRPNEVKALSTINNPFASNIFITTRVYIPPRPWFYSTARSFKSSNMVFESAEKRMAYEIDKRGLNES